jgi:asparagine synthase (glutamine-hydrolysing)
MRDSLLHRGPDHAGLWLDADAGIALAHRRLSILDLSAAGHQPMVSASGRYVLVFNGEIYNHLQIRRMLDGEGLKDANWRGHSDTETLLAAIEQWGMERTLRECVGMFALALWDRQERWLSLARDRMGEKPLYYGWQGNTLLFGSELKALQAHPAFRSEIDRNVVPLYLRHGYIPAPWSIWKGIRKLTPGCIVEFRGDRMGELRAPHSYWSLADTISAGQADPFRGSDEEAITAFEQQLSESIAGQMVADVPLGAFLSGGIDSSTVVALMQAQSIRPVQTFTIGFAEDGYNEAEHAKTVAHHLCTEHTELYVTAAQAQEVIPKLATIYDEPFGDASAIPTHLVSQLTRRHVTVSLSGDGGDELLGGYDRYLRVSRLWAHLGRVPPMFRKVGAKVLRLGGHSAMDPLYWRCGARRNASLAERMQFWADYLEARSADEMYDTAMSLWRHPAESRFHLFPQVAHLDEPIERMMVADSLAYLPDDILVKVDRAAMAVSLETRVPLLDHRVVELAWRLPYAMKVRGGQGKWMLRQVLYRHVPPEIIDRPKMGFGVPVDEWMRGPLREWAEDLLNESELKNQGLLDPKPIRARWQQHVKGQHNWRDSLWPVLMFQACAREKVNGR